MLCGNKIWFELWIRFGGCGIRVGKHMVPMGGVSVLTMGSRAKPLSPSPFFKTNVKSSLNKTFPPYIVRNTGRILDKGTS